MTRARPAPRSEIVIVDACIGHIISAYERSHARKVHGSRFQQAGEPDIDAAINGRAVKVEVKMPGEVPTPIQYAAMRRWERAGALAGWCTSTRELELLLGHLEDPQWRNPQICKHRHKQVVRTGEQCVDCGATLEGPPSDGL